MTGSLGGLELRTRGVRVVFIGGLLIAAAVLTIAGRMEWDVREVLTYFAMFLCPYLCFDIVRGVRSGAVRSGGSLVAVAGISLGTALLSTVLLLIMSAIGGW